MPRGKYVRKNKRNENTLTTKLMRISLRMDDHIYNDKPIATSEAAAHLQEIAVLKQQCLSSNVRALQVIEKLTRFMDKILTDEDTGYVRSCDKPFQMTEFAGSTSPVYSLPDEDRVHNYGGNPDLNTTNISDDDVEIIRKDNNFSHGIKTNRLVESVCQDFSCDGNRTKDMFRKKATETDLKTTQTRKQVNISNSMINLKTSDRRSDITVTQAGNLPDPKNDLDDGDIIDITDHSDTEGADQFVAVSNEPNVTIEHVNTGISNMVIQDELCDQKKIDDDCSQSILDNYFDDKRDEEVTNERDIVIKKDTNKEKDMKRHVINKVNKYFQIQTPLGNVSSQERNDKAAKLICSQPVKVNLKCSPVKPVTIMQKHNKDNAEENIKIEVDIKPKTKRAKKNSKLIKNITIHNDDPKITNNFKDIITKSAVKEKRQKVTRKAKKKVQEIYNQNVENDLSWVENIRYVREIAPDEYDPALSMLQDSFWDNFELPAVWNDLDFEV